jgi:hypothetical protein
VAALAETSALSHLSVEQKAAIALEWSEQIRLSPDPEKNRRRGRPKALASRHGCRSSVDLAGRTRKIKISAPEFSLQLGAPNLRSKLMKPGVRGCLGIFTDPEIPELQSRSNG